MFAYLVVDLLIAQVGVGAQPELTRGGEHVARVILGILLENYAGHLPLWLAPIQAIVTTITSDSDEYAAEITAMAQRLGLRAESDLRNEKINYKVREHSLAKVPVMLVVGKKEAAERLVSVRRLGKEGQQVMPLDAALKALTDEAVPPDLRRLKQAA